MLALLLLAGTAQQALGQVADSARTGVRLLRPDSGVVIPPPRVEDPALKPPISPRRAFLYSLILPGAGQAKLDRGYAGSLFFVIEIAALTLVHRSAEDLRLARTFGLDSVPLSYTIDPNTGRAATDAEGNPLVASWEVSRYTQDRIRARRLHYEDWIAAMLFNHLFAGADAFVAAQLWDLPARVAIKQTPFGPAIAATFKRRFR